MKIEKETENEFEFGFVPKTVEEHEKMTEIKTKAESIKFIRRLVTLCVTAVIAMPFLSIAAVLLGLGVDAGAIIDKVIMVISGVTTTALGIVIGKNLDKKD